MGPVGDVFLGREEVLRLLKGGKIKIEPFLEENLGPVSYDLTLGNHFRVFTPGELEVFDDNLDMSKIGELVRLEDHEFIELEPGEMVLGITREKICLPDNIVGILSGRSRFARAGLMVHISSNIVHPGSCNKQVLEIVNLGPFKIRLYPGVKICQVAFAEVRGGTSLTGRYAKQELP